VHLEKYIRSKAKRYIILSNDNNYNVLNILKSEIFNRFYLRLKLLTFLRKNRIIENVT